MVIEDIIKMQLENKTNWLIFRSNDADRQITIKTISPQKLTVLGQNDLPTQGTNWAYVPTFSTFSTLSRWKNFRFVKKDQNRENQFSKIFLDLNITV